jgi:hypothetical protein
MWTSSHSPTVQHRRRSTPKLAQLQPKHEQQLRFGSKSSEPFPAGIGDGRKKFCAMRPGRSFFSPTFANARITLGPSCATKEFSISQPALLFERIRFAGRNELMRQ